MVVAGDERPVVSAVACVCEVPKSHRIESRSDFPNMLAAMTRSSQFDGSILGPRLPQMIDPRKALRRGLLFARENSPAATGIELFKNASPVA